MHVEVRVAALHDVFMFDEDSLRRVHQMLSDPERAGASSQPSSTAPTAASRVSRVSLSFSIDRLLELETNVKEVKVVATPLVGDQKQLTSRICQQKSSIPVLEALLLSVPVDVFECTIKIRLWQHLQVVPTPAVTHNAKKGHQPRHLQRSASSTEAMMQEPERPEAEPKRPNSVCIGIAKVRLQDIVAGSGGCRVTLTAKSVVDAYVLANNNYEASMATFGQEISSNKSSLIETGTVELSVSEFIFDQVASETLFCMASAPVPGQTNYSPRTPPPSGVDSDGLVISGRRHSSQAGSADASDLKGDAAAYASRIALSSPHTRLLLIPICVMIDLVLRIIDSFSWRQPVRTLLLGVIFFVVYMSGIAEVAVAIALVLAVAITSRSAVAFTLVDTLNPSKDGFLTNMDTVVYSRHSALYNGLVRCRCWMKQGLQSEAFFEVALVIQLLRQYGHRIQQLLLLTSASFALLPQNIYFGCMMIFLFVFLPLRVRYGAGLLPLTTESRLQRLQSAQTAPSNATAEGLPPSRWWRIMWKPSASFSQPFRITQVAKIFVEPTPKTSLAALDPLPQFTVPPSASGAIASEEAPASFRTQRKSISPLQVDNLQISTTESAPFSSNAASARQRSKPATLNTSFSRGYSVSEMQKPPATLSNLQSKASPSKRVATDTAPISPVAEYASEVEAVGVGEKVHHCAILVLTVREDIHDADSASEMSETHRGKGDVSHPVVEPVLSRILDFYNKIDRLPSRYQAFDISEAELHNQNQTIFEGASSLLLFLRKNIVDCKAFVTPAPPRYEFPSTALYRAESKAKPSCLVEMAPGDMVTASIVSVKKQRQLLVGKLPEDSSIDSCIRIHALISCMFLQGIKLSCFASNGQPRIVFVVPLTSMNAIPVAPNSCCPPHLTAALQEAWNGWSDNDSRSNSNGAFRGSSKPNPEILHHIISTYQQYWKNRSPNHLSVSTGGRFGVISNTGDGFSRSTEMTDNQYAFSSKSLRRIAPPPDAPRPTLTRKPSKLVPRSPVAMDLSQSAADAQESDAPLQQQMSSAFYLPMHIASEGEESHCSGSYVKPGLSARPEVVKAARGKNNFGGSVNVPEITLTRDSVSRYPNIKSKHRQSTTGPLSETA